MGSPFERGHSKNREGPKTKKLRGLEGLPYDERLHKLQLCTLELRRLHFDLYMCYRIIFGCVNVRVSEFFEFSHTAQTRGHPYKLYRRHSCNNVRSSYFAVRVINVWNSLPADSVDLYSFVAFKRTVQQIDFTSFLSC